MSQSKLYVGNLSYAVTADQLQDFFSQYGNIAELKLITDRETGRSKGFAFVTFDSAQDAQKALVADGTDLEGRNMKVNIARDNNDRGGRGRGGQGRRQGGGREDRW